MLRSCIDVTHSNGLQIHQCFSNASVVDLTLYGCSYNYKNGPLDYLGFYNGTFWLTVTEIVSVSASMSGSPLEICSFCSANFKKPLIPFQFYWLPSLWSAYRSNFPSFGCLSWHHCLQRHGVCVWNVCS